MWFNDHSYTSENASIIKTPHILMQFVWIIIERSIFIFYTLYDTTTIQATRRALQVGVQQHLGLKHSGPYLALLYKRFYVFIKRNFYFYDKVTTF